MTNKLIKTFETSNTDNSNFLIEIREFRDSELITYSYSVERTYSNEIGKDLVAVQHGFNSAQEAEQEAIKLIEVNQN